MDSSFLGFLLLGSPLGAVPASCMHTFSKFSSYPDAHPFVLSDIETRATLNQTNTAAVLQLRLHEKPTRSSRLHSHLHLHLISTSFSSPSSFVYPISNSFITRMYQKLAEIPELLEHVSRYLRPQDLFACIQVSSQWHSIFIPSLWHIINDGDRLCDNPFWTIPNDSDKDQHCVWLKSIFLKYGRHVRDLTTHESHVVEAASGACLALKSLKLATRFDSTDWSEQPPDAPSFTVSPSMFSELSMASDFVVPEIGEFETNSLDESSQVCLEQTSIFAQHYWHLVFSNRQLERLTFAGAVYVPRQIRSEQILLNDLAKLTHLKELHVGTRQYIWHLALAGSGTHDRASGVVVLP